MLIAPIHNQKELDAALARVDDLMDMHDGEGPDAESDEGMELQILSILVEKYEEEAFPMDLPSPMAAVRFALDQQGLGQADLAVLLKSRPRASELLNGNMKGLSRRMMQVLNKQLHIPAEILIQDFQKDEDQNEARTRPEAVA